MKRTISTALAIFMCLIFCVSAFAQEIGRLNDSALLLDETEKSELSVMINSYSEELKYDIVIVTVDNFSGYDNIEDFSKSYYYSGDYTDDGVILAVSMSERDYCVTDFGYSLSDDAVDYIIDDFISYLSNGKYYQAFELFAKDCYSMVKSSQSGDAYGTDSYTDYDRYFEEEHYESRNVKTGAQKLFKNLIVSIVVGIIAGLIATLSMKRKLKSVRPEKYAGNYLVDGSMNVTVCKDTFLFSKLSAVPKPKDPPPSSNNGGNTVHVSHSGGGVSSHSGKF